MDASMEVVEGSMNLVEVSTEESNGSSDHRTTFIYGSFYCFHKTASMGASIAFHGRFRESRRSFQVSSTEISMEKSAISMDAAAFIEYFIVF